MSNNKRGTKKNRMRESTIAALLSEPTHQAAAEKAGISQATLSRWLADPEFQYAYRVARRSVVEFAIGQLQSACGKAVEALVRNLEAARASDQIRAALGILEHANKGLETFDLVARLNEALSQLEGLRVERGEGDSASPVGSDVPEAGTDADAAQEHQPSADRPWLADSADDEDPDQEN